MRFLIHISFIIYLLSMSCSSDDSSPQEPEITSSLKPLNEFNFETFDCAQCTHVVTEKQFDGNDADVKPGDIICLDGSIAYEHLSFFNINGTASEPVIIRNCGGVAEINSDVSWGIRVLNSSHFKLLGDGGESNYGIKITTDKGFYLNMQSFTKNFEIAHVEIAGNGEGFAGMGIKTSPPEDCSFFEDPSRPWVMEDVIIRNNYIHDVNGEGLYIGHGFHEGWSNNKCTTITYPHLIRDISVYENIIENTGYDGIQIKNCDRNVEVYNNYIFNYGTELENGQNEGILIGDVTVGKFYNNAIIQGSGNGIRMLNVGADDIIYNNVIVDSGKSGIKIDGNPPFGYVGSDPYIYILNNTIINSGEFGFVIFDKREADRRFYNNLVISSARDLFAVGSNVSSGVDTLTNFVSPDISAGKFVDVSALNFKLLENSPGIDQGTDVSTYGVSVDIFGKPRPLGDEYDIGAFEQ